MIYREDGLYARFIPDFTKRATPLQALKWKEAKIICTQVHQCAFESLKQALNVAPILQVADFEKEFVLVTDDCYLAISDVLKQHYRITVIC